MTLLPYRASCGTSVQLHVCSHTSGCYFKSLVGTPLNFHIIKISSFADITMAIQRDSGTSLLEVQDYSGVKDRHELVFISRPGILHNFANKILA